MRAPENKKQNEKLIKTNSIQNFWKKEKKQEETVDSRFSLWFEKKASHRTRRGFYEGGERYKSYELGERKHSTYTEERERERESGGASELDCVKARVFFCPRRIRLRRICRCDPKAPIFISSE